MKYKYYLLVPFELIKSFGDPVERFIENLKASVKIPQDPKEAEFVLNKLREREISLKNRAFVVYKQSQKWKDRDVFGFYQFDDMFPLPCFFNITVEHDGKSVFPWSEMVVVLE